MQSFDEAWYLAKYPDVAAAIARGAVKSAYAHFEKHGRAEGREPGPSETRELVERRSYQSFEKGLGDSDSAAKFRALKFEKFSEATVLDLGCNEGYFAFEAAKRGAKRVVGQDRNPEILEDARARQARIGSDASQIEWICSDWSKLPDEKFDVVFLLSALHYASDQPALIARLLELLTPNGTLILECGVIDHEEPLLQNVTRSVDSLKFPTMGLFKQWLEPYAWKLVGRSVDQIGDPVPRKVFHIRRLKRIVVLALGEGYSGKTTLARKFGQKGIDCVMIDDHVRLWASERRKGGTEIGDLIANSYRGEDIAALYRKLLDGNLIYELADDVADHLETKKSDILCVEGALLHRRSQEQFAKRLEARGFYVWVTDHPQYLVDS